MWFLLNAALAAGPSLEVAAGACGAWTATVTASGRGRVELAVEGDVKAEWPLRREGRWEVQGAGTPGTRLRFDAHLKRDRVSAVLDLPAPDASIRVSPPERIALDGEEPRFDVQVTTPCALETLSWTATVRQTGARREGTFLGSGQAWFVLPAEQPGAYDVDVALLAAGGQPIGQAAVTVWVRPR